MQRANVQQQLSAGVRFLDIRTQYTNNDWWENDECVTNTRPKDDSTILTRSRPRSHTSTRSHTSLYYVLGMGTTSFRALGLLSYTSRT